MAGYSGSELERHQMIDLNLGLKFLHPFSHVVAIIAIEMNYVAEIRFQLVIHPMITNYIGLIDPIVAPGPLITKLVLPSRPNTHQQTKPPLRCHENKIPRREV